MLNKQYYKIKYFLNNINKSIFKYKLPLFMGKYAHNEGIFYKKRQKAHKSSDEEEILFSFSILFQLFRNILQIIVVNLRPN